MIQAPLSRKIAVAATVTSPLRALRRAGIRRSRGISRSVAPRGQSRCAAISSSAAAAAQNSRNHQAAFEKMPVPTMSDSGTAGTLP